MSLVVIPREYMPMMAYLILSLILSCLTTSVLSEVDNRTLGMSGTKLPTDSVFTVFLQEPFLELPEF